LSSRSFGSRIDPRSGKADVGFGSFCNHFSTKSELVEAAAAEVLEELVELFDRLSVDVEDAATASPSQADATVRSRPQIPRGARSGR
jgi:AcrR family transcriptional regulator